MGKIVLCPDAWKIPPPTLPTFVCLTCLTSANDDNFEVLGKGSGVAGDDVNFSGGGKEVNGRSVDEVAEVAEARKPLEDDSSPESGDRGEESSEVREHTP